MQRITRMRSLSWYEEGLQCTWRAGPSTGAWRAHPLTCWEDQVCTHLLGRCGRGCGTSGKFYCLRDRKQGPSQVKMGRDLRGEDASTSSLGVMEGTDFGKGWQPWAVSVMHCEDLGFRDAGFQGREGEMAWAQQQGPKERCTFSQCWNQGLRRNNSLHLGKLQRL